MVVAPFLPILFAPDAVTHVDVSTPPSADVAGSSEPTDASSIQYGVAFTIEGVASAGPLCVDPCVLGTGGGIAVRVGHRLTGPLYYGLAYELSKQASNNIFRLGILQQLRAEGRYYVDTGRVTLPFLQLGLGVAGYGNEWAIETRGPLASLGVGVESQISRTTVVGVGLAYRGAWLSAFTDSSGAYRPGGVASIVGVDLQLEGLDPWPFARSTAKAAH